MILSGTRATLERGAATLGGGASLSRKYGMISMGWDYKMIDMG